MTREGIGPKDSLVIIRWPYAKNLSNLQSSARAYNPVIDCTIKDFILGFLARLNHLYALVMHSKHGHTESNDHSSRLGELFYRMGGCAITSGDEHAVGRHSSRFPLAGP